MLQRGMKCPHLPLVQITTAVPSPSEWPLLMAPEKVSTQPGNPRVSKTSCCFSAAENSGKGCDVPGRGLRAAHLPQHSVLQQLPPPPLLQGLGRKAQHQEGPAVSAAKWGLLISYLEFCLKLVAIWPLSKVMNSLGVGREQLRGSGKQREGKAGEIQGCKCLQQRAN